MGSGNGPNGGRTAKEITMADKMMEKKDDKDDKALEREVEAQAKAAKPAKASKEGEVDDRKSKILYFS